MKLLTQQIEDMNHGQPTSRETTSWTYLFNGYTYGDCKLHCCGPNSHAMLLTPQITMLCLSMCTLISIAIAPFSLVWLQLVPVWVWHYTIF